MSLGLQGNDDARKPPANSTMYHFISEGRGWTVKTFVFDGNINIFFALVRRKSWEVHGLKKNGVLKVTLQEINISHLGKRKIIFKMPFFGYILVPGRVKGSIFLPLFRKNLLITIKATLSERRPGWKGNPDQKQEFPAWIWHWLHTRLRKMFRLVFPVDLGNIIQVVFCLRWLTIKKCRPNSSTTTQHRTPNMHAEIFWEGSQHQQLAPKRGKTTGKVLAYQWRSWKCAGNSKSSANFP